MDTAGVELAVVGIMQHSIQILGDYYRLRPGRVSSQLLAHACERGNEHAWQHFDLEYRPFIERLARHLASKGTDADEVMDSVYAELFGTKLVAGVRQSKFRSYTGRGTLRGWLRAVVSNAVVDLYRGRQDEEIGRAHV